MLITVGMVIDGAGALVRVSVVDVVDVDCRETGMTLAPPIEYEPATANSRITLSVILLIDTATLPILT